MSEFQEFPKWKYHAEKPACVVDHKEAEEALGHGWVDSPAHVHGKKPEAAKEESPAEQKTMDLPEIAEPAPTPKRDSRRGKL